MTIYKRNWRKKDGTEGVSYRVQVTLPDGKRFQKQFKTRREALAFEREPGAWTQAAASHDKVQGAIDAWEASIKRAGEIEPATIRMYGGFCRNHIGPQLGELTWRKFTRQAAEDFRDQLLEKVSRSTAKRILNTLKMIVEYAVEKKWVQHNATENVKIKPLRGRHVDRSTKKLDIHTKDEMQTVLACAEELANESDQRTAIAWKRYRVMLNLLVYAGLRSSELRGLPADAIDPSSMTLEVRQRADEKGIIGPPKSAAGYRVLPLPRHVAEMVEEWAGKVLGGSGLLFVSREGKALDHGNLTKRMWIPVQIKAGVTVRNFHSIRHFYASRLIEQRVRLIKLRELMGHHSETFTMEVYGHLFKDAREAAEDRALAEAIFLGEGERPS